MGKKITGQMDLFSSDMGQEENKQKETKQEKGKKARPNALQKELDKMARQAYEIKKLDAYRPTIATLEYRKKLEGKVPVMRRESLDQDAGTSVERFYYDYNIVLEIAPDGREELWEFDTAKEAVDHYFK